VQLCGAAGACCFTTRQLNRQTSLCLGPGGWRRALFSTSLGLATAAAISSATCSRDTWPPNSLSRGARRTLCVSFQSSPGRSMPPGRTMTYGSPLRSSATSARRFWISTPPNRFRMPARAPRVRALSARVPAQVARQRRAATSACWVMPMICLPAHILHAQPHALYPCADVNQTSRPQARPWFTRFGCYMLTRHPRLVAAKQRAAARTRAVHPRPASPCAVHALTQRAECMSRRARACRPAELAGAERRHHHVLVHACRGRRLDQRDRRVAVCAALRLSTVTCKQHCCTRPPPRPARSPRRRLRSAAPQHCDMRATLLHAAAASTSALAASPQRSLRLSTPRMHQ